MFETTGFHRKTVFDYGVIKRRVLFIVAVLSIVLAAALCFVAHADTSDIIEIIVERSSESGEVSIYVRAPANRIGALFASDLTALLNPDQRLNYKMVRQGTWQHHDALFGQNSATINGARASLETMSVMFHSNGDRLAFDMPLDAAVAVAVCSDDIQTVTVRLNDLTAYAALMVSTEQDAVSTASLVLGGRHAYKFVFRIRQFTDGRLDHVRTVRPKPDGTLNLLRAGN